MQKSSNGDERRSLERVSLRPEKPVHIEGNVDGTDVALLVENLSADGATMICPEDLNSISPGNFLEDCILNLPDIGRIPVTLIIRWRIWPKVGVQFGHMSDDAKNQIVQFLEKNP